MASSSPPHDLTELDYEAIEAAVTETVRGRWFLSEFARRNRMAETRQLLDAMERLEAAVVPKPSALPAADPSIRLMIQRIKEVSAQLGAIASHMSEAGIDDTFVTAVALQGRAVAGMLRGSPSPIRDGAAPHDLPPVQKAPPDRDTRRQAPSVLEASVEIRADDPRLAALSGLDGLPLAEKLTLFS